MLKTVTYSLLFCIILSTFAIAQSRLSQSRLSQGRLSQGSFLPDRFSGRYTVNRPIPMQTQPVTAQPVQPQSEQTPDDQAINPVNEQQEAEPELVFSNPPQRHTLPVLWETDFEYAKKLAQQSTRNLLIYLYADYDQDIHEALANLPVVSACREFDTHTLNDVFVRSGLDCFVPLKLPIDAKIIDETGEKQSIYTLPGFEHMLGHPGLIVIDFAHRDMPYYGEVVGILPFLGQPFLGGHDLDHPADSVRLPDANCRRAEQTEIFLTLPAGTLTQRTLTYAVRTHHDKPLSSGGVPAPIVVRLATEHAEYQAERGRLGHQNFGVRSYQAKEVLGGGSPSEICAQSRPGLGLFEGAISCMRAWRNSGAHWTIARRHHTYYGYDMVLGRNGAWYAVGFFIH